MYLKAKLHHSIFIGILLVASGCHTILTSSDDDEEPRRAGGQTTRLTSASDFQPDVQIAPSQQIRSLQLYHQDDRSSAPIIKKDDPDSYLTLRFDHLGTDTRIFRVRFTHYNAEWERTNLPRSRYITGFQQGEITGGQASSVQNPAYKHYSYTIPKDFEFELSGNYLLEIYSYREDDLLFSLPFFVAEDHGEISTSVERLYAGTGQYRLSHQLFTNYRFPGFVQMPAAEMKFYFVQNQFWGKTQRATEIDISRASHIRSYIRRENTFPGRYEFRELDIRELRQDGKRIIDYRPHTIPPELWLFRDIVDLNAEPFTRPSQSFGRPMDDRSGRYVRVHFDLEVPQNLRTEDPIYLIGAFNNWQVREANRMQYNEATRRYEGSAMMKQGVYDYKYVVQTSEGLDDLRLDASFFDGIQEYHTFAYFRDPRVQADRLIKFDRNTIRSR